MPKNIKVASIQDLKSGEIKTFIVEDKQIAVAQVGDEYFAVDDYCTHKKCSLGELGTIEGKSVVCGCHGAKFDLASGSVLALPATENLHTYSIQRNGDDIVIVI